MMEQSGKSGVPASPQERTIPKEVGEGLIENLAHKDMTTAEFDYVVNRLEKDASEEEFKFITEGEKALADEIAKSPDASGVEGKLAQARFADSVGKLKREFAKGVKVALVAAFSFLSQQGIAQNTETKTKTDIKKEAKSQKENNNPWKDEDYVTKDGNVRHFHNPKSGWYTETGLQKVSYAFGATETPFKTLEEMKEKTRVPKSLGETDFFSNYINARSETDDVVTDPETGNRYYNYHNTMDSVITGVPVEGDSHWNIDRFLLQPHYRDFGIPKAEARKNALNDMYKYFLYQEKGNRDSAWQKANDFIEKNIDVITESKFCKWYEENLNNIFPGKFEVTPGTYVGTSNLYQSDNTTSFVYQVLEHNGRVFNGEEKGRAYSKKEIRDILTDYNIVYRKKNPEEAARIAEESVNSEEKKWKDAYEETKNRPITESKIVFNEGVTGFPEGFDSWDPILQSDWHDKNVKSTTNPFTEEDRVRHMKLFGSHHFLEE